MSNICKGVSDGVEEDAVIELDAVIYLVLHGSTTMRCRVSHRRLNYHWWLYHRGSGSTTMRCRVSHRRLNYHWWLYHRGRTTTGSCPIGIEPPLVAVP